MQVSTVAIIAGTIEIILALVSFGMSAPIKTVTGHFGFVPEHIVAAAKEVLGRAG